jgi:hypothetical protein
LSHSASLFCDGHFQDRVLWTICLGWLQTPILLISASSVVRITGMSHQCLASLFKNFQVFLELSDCLFFLF